MQRLVKFSEPFLMKGLLPDAVIRQGIRNLLSQKLLDEKKGGSEAAQARFIKLINHLKSSPIAVQTKTANEQHYELPSEFFQVVLGKYLKYSSGYWRDGVSDLDTAEKDMLEITVERAQLAEGQSILELGCGWGSLSLFMAEKFPGSRIVAVSNSRTQKQFIDAQMVYRGIKNLEIITADMNVFTTPHKFDRVVSIEMFEHMRNYEKLLERIAGFLKPDGKLFVHIFTHREHAYLYDETDAADWIGRYFFTGGIMPSDHLLLYFQDHFNIENHWRVSGTHYQQTSEAWLKKMDARKEILIPIFQKTYGASEYKKRHQYWRIFFMACAELWGYREGAEWLVSHYLFHKSRGKW